MATDARAPQRVPETLLYDPGRERRAEARARALLRSCVNDEEWAMYRDLGFIRVWGAQADGPADADGTGGAAYAYLIYPHRPIVAYLAQTHRLLGEYCVAFPDETRPYGSARLPDSDDVLAKWMALTGDERRLIADGQHAPAGPPAGSRPGQARPVAAVAMGAQPDALGGSRDGRDRGAAAQLSTDRPASRATDARYSARVMSGARPQAPKPLR